MWLWLTNGLLTAFCFLVCAALLMFGNVPPILLLLVSVLAVTCVTFWFGMSAYRVGGGRNLIRFHADRIEVPATNQRKPLVFPRVGSQIVVRDVVVQYRVAVAATVARVNRGKLIELTHGAQKRKLSTLTLADEGDERALVTDLQRFVAGEPALGRAGHAAAMQVPRTELDDRLDRELAELD